MLAFHISLPYAAIYRSTVADTDTLAPNPLRPSSPVLGNPKQPSGTRGRSRDRWRVKERECVSVCVLRGRENRCEKREERMLSYFPKPLMDSPVCTLLLNPEIPPHLCEAMV